MVLSADKATHQCGQVPRPVISPSLFSRPIRVLELNYAGSIGNAAFLLANSLGLCLRRKLEKENTNLTFLVQAGHQHYINTTRKVFLLSCTYILSLKIGKIHFFC